MFYRLPRTHAPAPRCSSMLQRASYNGAFNGRKTYKLLIPFQRVESYRMSRESMFSFERRALQQCQHGRATVNNRAFATATAQPEILCSTREYSAGHNVATITVSDPSKLNVVGTSLLRKLVATCQQLSQDDNLRAVIITGAPTPEGKPSSFVGGADIKEMHQFSSPEEAREFILGIHKANQALRDLPVPVIARVHGLALGAGLEIVASCDLRIATKDSTFGMPEVRVGLPSIVEAAYFPGQIGMGRTRRLLYLAENFNGEEAERYGLVEKVVEDEQALDRAVDEWVGLLVSMGPKAIRNQKRVMQKWENCTVDEGIQAGVESFAEAFVDGGKEPKEYMAKFLTRKR